MSDTVLRVKDATHAWCEKCSINLIPDSLGYFGGKGTLAHIVYRHSRKCDGKIMLYRRLG